MNVYLLWHIHHASDTDGIHDVTGEIRIDEQAGDDVKLLGCYSAEERARERITLARLLPGFIDEPECFIVDAYTIDKDEWTEGYVTYPT